MKTILMLLMMSGVAMASTDWECKNVCIDKGYDYSFCNYKCNIPSEFDLPRIERIGGKRLEHKCFNDCVNSGFMIGQCKQECSY